VDKRLLTSMAAVTLIAEVGYATVNVSGLQPHARELGLVGHLGLFYAAFLVTETLLKSPMGLVADRVGRKKVIVLGAVSSCLADLSLTLVRHPALICLARALDGCGAACIWPNMYSMVGDMFDDRVRAHAMSVVNGMYITGIAIAPFIGGVANTYLGARLGTFTVASFYAAAVLFVLAAAAAYLALPGLQDAAGGLRQTTTRRSPVESFVMSLKAASGMLLVVFIAFAGVGLFVPIGKLYALEELKLTEMSFGWLFLSAAAGVGGSALFLGKVTDRVGKVRATKVGLSVFALGVWGIALSSNLVLIGICTVTMGLAFVLAVPAWLALATQTGDARERGATVAAVATAQGAGGVVGVALGPLLYNSLGRRFPFYASATALTTAAILALAAVRTEMAEAPAPAVEGNL
jgi:MFS family permease